MNYKIIPQQKYEPILTLQETEIAIKGIKDFFQDTLAATLNLRRITAPILVKSGLGINDDLNGVEQPVSFSVTNAHGISAEIVQSLAKWKRLMLAQLGLPPGEGLYADMNALRPDEVLGNLHSIYVDQWDWERVMDREERQLTFLKSIVEKIYSCIKSTENYIYQSYPKINPVLPDQITFIHAETLRRKFPQLTPREREDAICRNHGAVFIIGIGSPLKDDRPHDLRAPDYDDWSTATDEGIGLNGDILVWYPMLDRAIELSSMGIRVDGPTLEKQLAITGTMERKQLYFHQKLLTGELPLSIGGGIGQSRLCMFYLKKAHVGEVQASIWPEDMVQACRHHNINLI
jgi:aspartate--ammonia ligase